MIGGIAEINEEVLYTGDTSYVVDELTRDLMNDNLIVGKWYKIEGIRERGLYKDHYVIKDTYYPFESFSRDTREYYKKKYNLI